MSNVKKHTFSQSCDCKGTKLNVMLMIGVFIFQSFVLLRSPPTHLMSMQRYKCSQAQALRLVRNWNISGFLYQLNVETNPYQ